MVTLPGSGRMIFSQPYSKAGRFNMSLHASADSGASWTDLKNVDPGPSGYSALAAINGSAVDLAWEVTGSIRFGTFVV